MRHVRLFTPLIIICCHLAPLQAQTAQEEWEFLREAAKEVELYLPNQAIVNESDSKAPQNDEIIDEISTGRAAPVRPENAPTLRARSLEAVSEEVLPPPSPTAGPGRAPALPGRRFRSR